MCWQACNGALISAHKHHVQQQQNMTLPGQMYMQSKVVPFFHSPCTGRCYLIIRQLLHVHGVHMLHDICNPGTEPLDAHCMTHAVLHCAVRRKYQSQINDEMDSLQTIPL